ncbi:MAG: ABC transporter ATP-binding protein, partial [Clostridia bacterium]|nr:ABC transporter ATP-binding protein [Clostridia bacterium]
AQILDLLRNLKEKINSSIMLITHDLGVIAEMADYVVVMYAGRVVEKGTAHDIFHNPCHPYTIGLMKSKPVVGKQVDELYNIPGNVPNPVNMPDYCYFRDRCEACDHGLCAGKYPSEIRISDTHVVSCHLFADKGEEVGRSQIISNSKILEDRANYKKTRKKVVGDETKAGGQNKAAGDPEVK